MGTNRKTRGSATQANGRKTHTSGKVVPLRSTNSGKSRQTNSAAKAKSVQPARTVTYEQIAQRAETIWHKRGRTPDQDEQNWHEAEAQLKDELGIE